MDSITSKAVVKRNVDAVMGTLNADDAYGIAQALQETLLNKKIRFPLLEAAAQDIYKYVQPLQSIAIADAICELKTIGGNVLAGIILQLHLEEDIELSFEKAAQYIAEGNEWYVCDIIGERVAGYALLTRPEAALPILRRWSNSDNKWLVRCIGVAAHYAIKKGLKKNYVVDVFKLLLSLGNTTEFHTKKGIGWAAKTAAKFYPEMVSQYMAQEPEVKQWFKTKIKIGMGRSFKYAGKYNG